MKKWFAFLIVLSSSIVTFADNSTYQPFSNSTTTQHSNSAATATNQLTPDQLSAQVKKIQQQNKTAIQQFFNQKISTAQKNIPSPPSLQTSIPSYNNKSSLTGSNNANNWTNTTTPATMQTGSSAFPPTATQTPTTTQGSFNSPVTAPTSQQKENSGSLINNNSNNGNSSSSTLFGDFNSQPTNNNGESNSNNNSGWNLY